MFCQQHWVKQLSDSKTIKTFTQQIVDLYKQKRTESILQIAHSIFEKRFYRATQFPLVVISIVKIFHQLISTGCQKALRMCQEWSAHMAQIAICYNQPKLFVYSHKIDEMLTQDCFIKNSSMISKYQYSLVVIYYQFLAIWKQVSQKINKDSGKVQFKKLQLIEWKYLRAESLKQYKQKNQKSVKEEVIQQIKYVQYVKQISKKLIVLKIQGKNKQNLDELIVQLKGIKLQQRDYIQELTQLNQLQILQQFKHAMIFVNEFIQIYDQLMPKNIAKFKIKLRNLLQLQKAKQNIISGQEVKVVKTKRTGIEKLKPHQACNSFEQRPLYIYQQDIKEQLNSYSCQHNLQAQTFKNGLSLQRNSQIYFQVQQSANNIEEVQEASQFEQGPQIINKKTIQIEILPFLDKEPKEIKETEKNIFQQQCVQPTVRHTQILKHQNIITKGKKFQLNSSHFIDKQSNDHDQNFLSFTNQHFFPKFKQGKAQVSQSFKVKQSKKQIRLPEYLINDIQFQAKLLINKKKQSKKKNIKTTKFQFHKSQKNQKIQNFNVLIPQIENFIPAPQIIKNQNQHQLYCISQRPTIACKQQKLIKNKMKRNCTAQYKQYDTESKKLKTSRIKHKDNFIEIKQNKTHIQNQIKRHNIISFVKLFTYTIQSKKVHKKNAQVQTGPRIQLTSCNGTQTFVTNSQKVTKTQIKNVQVFTQTQLNLKSIMTGTQNILLNNKQIQTLQCFRQLNIKILDYQLRIIQLQNQLRTSREQQASLNLKVFQSQKQLQLFSNKLKNFISYQKENRDLKQKLSQLQRINDIQFQSQKAFKAKNNFRRQKFYKKVDQNSIRL